MSIADSDRIGTVGSRGAGEIADRGCGTGASASADCSPTAASLWTNDGSPFTQPDFGRPSAVERYPRTAVVPLPAPRDVIPSNSNYPLIAILGPTASGKSALALNIAERWQGEVINFDSIQIYRGCDVGAGKVSVEQRRGIPHHLLDWADAAQTVTAGDYASVSRRILADIRERGHLPVFAGGTGLYLRALLDGLFEGPKRSEELRLRLRKMAERHGREFLHKMLQRFDPKAAARIEPKDAQKLIRALEVCILAGRPISELQAHGRERLEGFRSIKVGLDPGRATLYERIERRVESMFTNGLLEEVQAMLARPDAAQLKPLEALGYRQAAEYLRGNIGLPEAIRQTQKETRHYAKRQMTWFRREANVTWFSGCGDDVKVQRKVLDHLEGLLSAAPAAGLPGCEHE
jgi:tRNA dimethylallyltransferase